VAGDARDFGMKTVWGFRRSLPQVRKPPFSGVRDPS
jgi:hypothetical protein